jgi:micrococcal nuclease
MKLLALVFIVACVVLGGQRVAGFIADAMDKTVEKVTPAQAGSNRASGKVISVTDGDTLRVKIDGKSQAVRLLGIDTPETRKPGVGVECGGKQATANLKRLAPVGARAKLTFDSTQDQTDRYGRLIAYVRVNGKKLELEQIYDGWAKVYVYGKKFSSVDDYQVAEGVAKRARRGVWSRCGGDFHSEQS